MPCCHRFSVGVPIAMMHTIPDILHDRDGFIYIYNPPANFLYKMVGHVPHIKPFFYREFLVLFWMLEPVLYHFTFLDLCTSIL